MPNKLVCLLLPVIELSTRNGGQLILELQGQDVVRSILISHEGLDEQKNGDDKREILDRAYNPTEQISVCS